MAERSDDKNLPDIFKDIWKCYDRLEKTEESTNSDINQGIVRHACEQCKLAVDMVNKLHLFSNNENIDEVATNEIKYMLLPAFMGYFLMKNTVRSRLPVVKESQDFYTDFLRLCKSYSVTDHEIPEAPNTEEQRALVARAPPNARPTVADVRGMAGGRNAKIQRYKAQKELEKKLTDLRDEVEKEHVDDEVKRDYYSSMLKRWVNVAIDELESISSEIGILEMMEARKQQGDKHSNNESQKKAPEKPPPLRPFIITKNMLQKQVYGLGYPGIPTMTIEEFFDKKVAEGDIHIPGAEGHSMQDWAMDPEKDKEQREKEDTEKEQRQEVDDPDELRKAREWDEYRDDHRRGWGNRHNMG